MNQPTIIRDGETTIKMKICVFEGGGKGGREENRPKTLFFLAKLKPGFINRVLVAVIFEASKCL